MAKTISISQAEYDYLLEIVASDGLTIAKLEEENRMLKKQLAKGGEQTEQVREPEDND